MKDCEHSYIATTLKRQRVHRIYVGDSKYLPVHSDYEDLAIHCESCGDTRISDTEKSNK